MKKRYAHEVQLALTHSHTIPDEILTEKDIQHLPEPVQRYIRYTGSIGKPKLKNVYVKASGRIRSNPGSWMNFTYEQHNTFDQPVRAFYMTARKMGIPVTGLHLYKNATAEMVIKLLGLFTVADARGAEMDQGETVTVFNDMCFMAPASLIDAKIQWQPVDQLHAHARFTNGAISISADLTFAPDGRLIDFISYDRFETADGKVYRNLPWRTPVKEYADFNGYRLPAKADVIYIRPEGEFCYLEFNAVEISYNK